MQKDTAVDKQRKHAVTADNKALRSFRKGRGAFAKLGHKRKVRCKCKGCGQIATAAG